MRIEAHDKLGKPIKADITRIVIFDDFGNPIALALQLQPNWTFVAHCRDAEFKDALGAFGIDKVLIVDTIEPHNLKPLQLK